MRAFAPPGAARWITSYWLLASSVITYTAYLIARTTAVHWLPDAQFLVLVPAALAGAAHPLFGLLIAGANAIAELVLRLRGVPAAGGGSVGVVVDAGRIVAGVALSFAPVAAVGALAGVLRRLARHLADARSYTDAVDAGYSGVFLAERELVVRDLGVASPRPEGVSVRARIAALLSQAETIEVSPDGLSVDSYSALRLDAVLTAVRAGVEKCGVTAVHTAARLEEDPLRLVIEVDGGRTLRIDRNTGDMLGTLLGVTAGTGTAATSRDREAGPCYTFTIPDILSAKQQE